MTRHPWKPSMPIFRDVVTSARLVTRAGSERTFWGESWASHTTLLTELVGVLRSSRPAQIVDVDEGWRPDRDLSLAIGRWGWLHVRTLVEEHEHGACLFRVRARLRPSFVGTLRGVTLAVLAAGGMSASVFLYDLSVTLFVSAVVVAAIGARAAWQAIRAAVVLDQAVTSVSLSEGLIRLPISMASKTSVEAKVEPEIAPAAEPSVEPPLDHVADRTGAPPVRAVPDFRGS
jgi:hypothetical protein